MGVDKRNEDPVWLAHPYVHIILDAWLEGKPLNFRGHNIPDDVKKKLEEARASGKLDSISIEEYRQLFDLQWTRSREANELWRAEDPENRKNKIADLGDLLTWLMSQIEAAKTKNISLLAANKKLVERLEEQETNSERMQSGLEDAYRELEAKNARLKDKLKYFEYPGDRSGVNLGSQVPMSELRSALDAYQQCLEGTGGGYEKKLANLYMALEPLRLKYGEKNG